MKKDFTITIIEILKWITLSTLTFITIGIILYMLNNEPFSDWLSSMKIYQTYYSFINFLTPVLAFFIVGTLILLIPYAIVSTWLGVIFLIKYIQKKRNIVKTLLLSFSLILLLFTFFKVFPFTSEYIIKINSKVDQISNITISEYVKENVRGNPYIINIKISRNLSDEYNSDEYIIKINYFDKWFKTKEEVLAGSNYYLLEHAENLTNQKIIISVILLIITIILYIYFCKYIINEYYQLINKEKEIDKNFEKHNLIANYTLVALFAIVIIIVIVYIITDIYKDNHRKPSVSENVEYTNNINNEITTDNKEMEWMFENNIGISIKYHGSWSGRDIITFNKTTDGGKTYVTQNPEGFDVHYGWKALFINGDIGFINDSGNRDYRGFYVTNDSGKTFIKANFIHSNEINEENLFVEGLPYYENGILKLKVYELKNPRNIYYEFYSEDNGLNWKILD